MSRNWFVVPETVRLDLPGGGWIEVKERLTYGEEQRLTGAALTNVIQGTDEQPEVGIDLERYNILRLFIWVVDWSPRDGEGNPMPVSKEAISALDPVVAEEIDDALTAHVKRLEASKNVVTPG